MKYFKFCISFLVISFVNCQKYKFCVVDGRGGFKRSQKFCPILDQSESKVECVLGVDRLDCLRQINKGLVDFSVFTPEDLVTATNSEIEILITNELRYTKDEFEYEVVAIVRDDSGIRSRHDLKGRKFCHPGYGYQTDWTRILSNYMEASVIPHSCDPKLSLTENKIKASSEFFTSACKAGPWVYNATLDQQLKIKYPNLCELCGNRCSMQDKYWGRRGSLYCLTDGNGEISWARLDDVKVHFGLSPGGQEATPEGYSFLCLDGTLKPLNSNHSCVWVVKPWPVIATKRTSAQGVQKLLSNLHQKINEKLPWELAFLSLIEVYHLTIEKLEPIVAIESYLSKAKGFLNANSFSGCHPPRTIKICTTSIIDNYKCSWLRESAAAYGIEPDLDCLKAENQTHCMEAVNASVADIVMVTPDYLHYSKKYNLKTLFYEAALDQDKYLTVAISKNKILNKIEDLNGLRACFPSFDGIAWNSVAYHLKRQHLINCPSDMFKLFHLRKNQTNLGGEYGAIKCLLNNKGDVAFVSKHSLEDYFKSPQYNGNVSISDLNILCDDNNLKNGCHLSWAPLSYGMVRGNNQDLWLRDTLDVFMQLDNLFGKNYKTITNAFQLFGIFSRRSNVLFHDNTVGFRGTPTAKQTDKMPRHYEDIIKYDLICTTSNSITINFSFSLILLSFVINHCDIFYFKHCKM